jgi:uncharacterized integral membrane protein
MRSERNNASVTPLDMKNVESSEEESEEFTKEDRKEMHWMVLAFVILGVVFFLMLLVFSSSNSIENEKETVNGNFGNAIVDTSRR